MSPIPDSKNATNLWHQNFEVEAVTEHNFNYPDLNDYQNAGIYLYGICLILIPTATILGNLLVIVSVLRFRALHSSINFLILGLAVADLFVALFVMPYAVYVYMQGGFWFLGPLMCDIYSASDVACSTASILLLAVISFDRYRAVSRPIQYSRQSHNIKRVIFILIGIWVISLALASPIVLGVNDRPDDASPYECRLYNPEFSILSSMVSFVIPCFVVLFVYIRIMIALRKREKAARLRRMNASQYNSEPKNKEDQDEAGQIVAGPDEKDLGGSSTPLSSSSDSLSENLHIVTNDFASENPTTASRRSSDSDFTTPNNIMSMDVSGGMKNYKSIDKSRHYTTHDKKKRRKFTNSLRRRSLTMPNVDHPAAESNHVIPSILRHLSRRSPRIFRNRQVSSTTPTNKTPENDEKNHRPQNNFLKSKSASVRLSKNKPTIFENPSAKLLSMGKLTSDALPTLREGSHKSDETVDLLASNSNMTTTTAALLTTTLTRSKSDRAQKPSLSSRTFSTGMLKRPTQPTENCTSPLLTYSTAETSIVRNERESTINTTQTTLEDDVQTNEVATTAASAKLGLIIPNDSALDAVESPKMRFKPKVDEGVIKEECNSPTVTFNIAGKTFIGGTGGAKNGNGYVNPMERRRSSGGEIISESNKPSGSSAGFPSSISSNVISSENDSSTQARIYAQRPRPKKSISHNTFDIHGSQFLRSKTLDADEEHENKRKVTNPRINGGPSAALAIKAFKRSVNKKDGSSLKRKVTKAQRKEKRATKTLGIVVGVFLICWVPFFTINILNGVCVRFDWASCQVGFDIFFYATWIGYMNSFMNPVIYTIFNTEFRRAFKSLILGRNAVRRHRARPV